MIAPCTITRDPGGRLGDAGCALEQADALLEMLAMHLEAQDARIGNMPALAVYGIMALCKAAHRDVDAAERALAKAGAA